jgi:hypothetical protein
MPGPSSEQAPLNRIATVPPVLLVILILLVIVIGMFIRGSLRAVDSPIVMEDAAQEIRIRIRIRSRAEKGVVD